MKDFVKRLTSRKFLLTIAACITFYVNGQYTELAATLITYMIAQGSSDAVSEYSKGKQAVAEVKKETALVESGLAAAPDASYPSDNTAREIVY